MQNILRLTVRAEVLRPSFWKKMLELYPAVQIRDVDMKNTEASGQNRKRMYLVRVIWFRFEFRNIFNEPYLKVFLTYSVK
jgi:hypothetical protein